MLKENPKSRVPTCVANRRITGRYWPLAAVESIGFDEIGTSTSGGIVKLTDFREISPITMPAKLLILGYGWNRIRVENEQIPVNLTVPALGQYENFTGPTQDYTCYSLTLEKSGFYGRYAGFSQDFMGEYVEVGYSATVAEIDLGISIIFANDDLIGVSDESAVFTIGKSFAF